MDNSKNVNFDSNDTANIQSQIFDSSEIKKDAKTENSKTTRVIG